MNEEKIQDNKDYFNLLEEFSTTEISDALSGENVMDIAIKPISNNMKVIGRALTVKLPFEESKLALHAIDLAKEDDVIVIDTSRTTSKAAWGDVKTTMALQKRIAGVIVDGAIRDLNKNIELGLPIFTKYVTPAASGKGEGGEINVDIYCGNVKVSPGDFIVGDENGVVVIPKDRIQEVLNKARIKLESDNEKIKQILGV